MAPAGLDRRTISGATATRSQVPPEEFSMPTSWPLKSDRVALQITELGGQLDQVRFRTATGVFEPMHVAPWTDEPLDDDIPPMLRMLRGDFFCAPFGDSDILDDEPRPHGAPANAQWRRLAASEDALELELEKPVCGARVTKRVHLHHGHAVVYQEHELAGGDGDLPIGHHAMLKAEQPLLLSFSPTVWRGTPPAVFEGDPDRGRSLLKYSATFDDLAHVPLASGDTADLTTYPRYQDHEDLLMLVADPAVRPAWTCAVNPRAGWIWFALKDAAVLRNTVLWMSNGGRYYPPFSRRHKRVLGLEETTSYFHLGHAASTTPNILTGSGYPTAVTLEPDQPLRVRYLFGLATVPGEFGHVQSVHFERDGLTFVDEHGLQTFAPCDITHVLP
jgi:hypothetical protein